MVRHGQVQVHMCVCAYVCYVCMYERVHVCVCVPFCAWSYLYVWALLSLDVCTHSVGACVYVCVCVYVSVSECVCVLMCAVCARMSGCMYACTCPLCMMVPL